MKVFNLIMFGLLAASLMFFVSRFYDNQTIQINYSDAKKSRLAFAEIRTLQFAIMRYRAEYSRWPCDSKKELEYGGEKQRDIMAALNGSNRSLNPKGIAFLVGRHGETIEIYLDPWGKPYKIGFDLDADHKFATQQFGTLQGEGPFIWTDSATPIKSWEPLPRGYAM